MAKYTKIPENTFQKLQINAGILLSDFTPSTAAVDEDDIIGATSGGISFTATPSFTDAGEDIDNAPKNTMELKRLDTWDVKASGTFATVDTAVSKMLIAAADIGTTDATKVTPRGYLDEDDFADLWIVGDYSDKNEDSGSGVTPAHTAGFIAIHMLNTLSTGGFQLQTADKEKGKFSFEFTAHYSLTAPDTVPFEVYIKAGT